MSSPEVKPGAVISHYRILLQELFTSRPAHQDSTDYLEALDKAQRGDSRPVIGLGSDLTALINRLKSAAPAQRLTAVDTLERLRWIRDTPRRRLRHTIAVGIAAVLLLGAAKYTIDLSRERTAAVEARQEADRRRDQAEDLIGFMLGDLRGKLQQAGRLDLLDSVGTKAMAYFDAVPPESLSTDELHRRSQALYQLGQIRQARGDLPAALFAYRESLQLASDVAARDPNNAEWQLGLATAHFYVGEALRRQSKLRDAMQEFVAYRDIAQRLVVREPENERFLLELSYGPSSVSAVQEAQGDLEGARSTLEADHVVRQDLLRRAPDNLERLQAVATGHNRLGVVLDKLGETDRAIQQFLADLQIRQALVAKRPDDRSIRRGLQVAHAYIGGAYEDAADLDAALQQYRAWIELSGALAAADPENADWARDLGRGETRLAGLQQLRGHYNEAEAGYTRALAILRPIVSRAATDALRRRDLAHAELGMAQLRLARRDTSGALGQIDAVDRALEPLIAKPGDIEAARIAAEAYLLAGDALAAEGRLAEAMQQRERAHKVLEPLASRLTEKRALGVWVRVLLALNRRADARPVFERLQALGYRHPQVIRAWAEAQP